MVRDVAAEAEVPEKEKDNVDRCVEFPKNWGMARNIIDLNQELDMKNNWERRQWLQRVGMLCGTIGISWNGAHGRSAFGIGGDSPSPLAELDIGSRRELFIDDWLIEESRGCRRNLNRPERREIAFRTDAPWEGNGSGYQSVVRDGQRWLMYYRGGHHPASPAYEKDPRSWETLCVAVSEDGLNWTRPQIGKIEFRGSKRNNLILDQSMVAAIQGSPAHTAVFRDQNPACPASERFKMVIRGRKPKGLYLMVSADGIDFRLKSASPFTTQGAFDSQNVMFWDGERGVYREYHRAFQGRVRGIMTAESRDPTKFPAPRWLEFPGAARHALYTNQVQPYYRAPHLLLGFPMRYVDRGLTPATKRLPNSAARDYRMAKSRRYGTAVTDALFMSSRDGIRFELSEEAFIRPGPSREDTWVYGDNFIFWGLAETPSPLPNAPPEISLYATEGYWEGEFTSVRRYASRLDGFVSLNAPHKGGEVLTKPLRFSGDRLQLNVSTSAAGLVRVGLETPDRKPLPGFSLADCDPLYGDGPNESVSWRGKTDLKPMAGRPVRIRFQLHDADLYAFQFIASNIAK